MGFTDPESELDPQPGMVGQAWLNPGESPDWLAPLLVGAAHQEALAAMAGVCSVAGCGRPAHARTWCGSHLWRWRRYGDVLAHVPIGRKRRPYERGDYSPAAVAERRRVCRAHFARKRERDRARQARARVRELEAELKAARNEYRWWDIEPLTRRLVRARRDL